MGLRIVALLLGMFVVLGTSRVAADELETHIEALLSAGVETQVPRSAIVRLGPDAIPALIAVFEREGAAPYVRLRALSALGHFDDARAARYLDGVVRDALRDEARTDTRLVRSSLALARAIGARASLRSVPMTLAALEAVLVHDDPHVRRAAVRALAALHTRSAHDVLSARMAVERSELVRAALAEALQR